MLETRVPSTFFHAPVCTHHHTWTEFLPSQLSLECYWQTWPKREKQAVGEIQWQGPVESQSAFKSSFISTEFDQIFLSTEPQAI